MRRLISLVLVMLISAMTAVLAGEMPTGEQLIFRYTALLGVAGIQLDMQGTPETETEQFSGARITSFDACKIRTVPEDYRVESAAILFPQGEVDETRALCFLLALDTDYNSASDIASLEDADAQRALAGAMAYKDIEYCGYKIIFAESDGIAYIGADGRAD